MFPLESSACKELKSKPQPTGDNELTHGHGSNSADGFLHNQYRP